MSSVTDQVRAARNPQEAMLALAAGIDRVLEQLAVAAPADPWAMGEWTTVGQTADGHDIVRGTPDPRFAAVRVGDEVDALRQRLATETDGEERMALEARLRLLTDDGQALEVGPEQGTRETYEGDEEAGVVVIPPPSPERQANRIAFARAHSLHEFSELPAEEFYPAYGKGGPMWLYAGYRDGVMQMPGHLRQALVTDVMQDSDAAAQEMARDILKDAGTGQSAAFAAEALGG